VESNRTTLAVCLKATSQVGGYKNNPAKMSGAIFYCAGEVSFFEKDTVIEPENQFPLMHSNLMTQHATGHLEILGVMPKDFLERLRHAIDASHTMSKNQKRRLVDLLKLGEQ
jgi:hypothetical protein